MTLCNPHNPHKQISYSYKKRGEGKYGAMLGVEEKTGLTPSV
jgi:hypothetical protein